MSKPLLPDEEIWGIVGIVVLVILVTAGIGASINYLAELKDNSPIIFWAIIIGVLILLVLMFSGIRYLITHIKNKG